MMCPACRIGTLNGSPEPFVPMTCPMGCDLSAPSPCAAELQEAKEIHDAWDITVGDGLDSDCSG